jgi:hypothetical protein
MSKKEKILLGMLPLWDRLIPPMGIACLKNFLQHHGYRVKAVDANIEQPLKDACDNYFDTLKESIPPELQSNFYSITYDVFANHTMAYVNHTDGKAYAELSKLLVYHTFYLPAADSLVAELNRIVARFFARLETYLLELLEREQPTVFGLSAFTGTLAASLFAFRLAKRRFPRLKTWMGGGVFANQLALGSPNLLLFLERTEDCIDKLFVGESELLVLNYLRGQLPESRRVYTTGDIKKKSPDLSEMFSPAFSDFNLAYYNNLAYFGSRGCPLACKFCSETVLWGTYRRRHTRQMAAELARLKETHRFQLFLFCDSLLNPIVTDLANELIKQDQFIYWDGYLKVDQAAGSLENTILWRQGGFYRARMGIESGSPRVLRLMGKNITVDQIKAALAALAEAGIKTTTYWVIGFPGETEADFRQTLDLLAALKDDIYEADCNPFWYFLNGQPGTDRWAALNKSVQLYPPRYRDMLLLQTWRLDVEPNRQETYRRINRFVQHCRRLGIPNPYSLSDIYRADRRWKKLHRNAAPMLVEFQDGSRFINESRRVRRLTEVHNPSLDDGGDFDF